MDNRVQDKVPVGRGVLEVLLVSVLAFGALLTGCAPGGEETTVVQEGGETTVVVEETTAQQAGGAARNVVVRVSGTEGVDYTGTYGTSQGVQTADGTVGTEPTDYPVDLQGDFDLVSAAFAKTQLGDETLTVEIVADGEVVADGETTSDFGAVNVNWTPQQGEETTESR